MTFELSYRVLNQQPPHEQVSRANQAGGLCRSPPTNTVDLSDCSRVHHPIYIFAPVPPQCLTLALDCCMSYCPLERHGLATPNTIRYLCSTDPSVPWASWVARELYKGTVLL